MHCKIEHLTPLDLNTNNFNNVFSKDFYRAGVTFVLPFALSKGFYGANDLLGCSMVAIANLPI